MNFYNISVLVTDGLVTLKTRLFINVTDYPPVAVGKVENQVVSFDDAILFNFRSQTLYFWDPDNDRMNLNARCLKENGWNLVSHCFSWLYFGTNSGILKGSASKTDNLTTVVENGVIIYREKYLFRVQAIDIAYLEDNFQFYIELNHVKTQVNARNTIQMQFDRMYQATGTNLKKKKKLKEGEFLDFYFQPSSFHTSKLKTDFKVTIATLNI